MPRDQSTTESKIGPDPTNTLKPRLANFLFGDIISQATSHAVANLSSAEAATAAISVRVDDGPDGLAVGWQPLAPSGRHDRDYTEWLQDQEDALEAWRKNFLVPRIITLTRSYVLGARTCAAASTLSSAHRDVNRFVNGTASSPGFLHHPRNNLPNRYGPMCDELTRAGELFPVLFTIRSYGPRRRHVLHPLCPRQPDHPHRNRPRRPRKGIWYTGKLVHWDRCQANRRLAPIPNLT